MMSSGPWCAYSVEFKGFRVMMCPEILSSPLVPAKHLSCLAGISGTVHIHLPGGTSSFS